MYVVLCHVVKGIKTLSVHLHCVCLVLVNGTILDLVHLIELGLKSDKILALFRFNIDELFLELLKRVSHHEEVAMAQEEVKIALLRFLGNLLGR